MFDYIFIGGWASDNSVWDKIAPKGSTLLGWNCLLNNDNLLYDTIVACQNPVVLVGWSLGGLLALTASANDQLRNKISRLVLISSAARMCSDEKGYIGADNRAIKAMRLRLRKNQEAVLHDFAENCFSFSATTVNTQAEIIEAYIQQGLKFSAEELKNGLDYLLTSDLRKSLAAVTCRVEIIHGSTDQIIPYTCAQFLRDNLNDSVLHTIDNGSHSLPITKKDFLRRIILEDSNE